MKKFLKNNLLYIILIFIGIILFFVSMYISVLLPFVSIYFGIVGIVLGIKLKKRGEKLEEENSPSKNYFDATKLDYDEDIYYIGEKKSMAKSAKGYFSKINSKMPAIICFFIGGGFLILGFFAILKMFL